MGAALLIFLIPLGACIGSFLNVVIYRLPRGESIVFPGSHCPTCGRAIRWHDNIPLVSWFALRGHCRQCKAAISPRYVVIEAATALIVGGLYACFHLLDIRNGAGQFNQTWATYAAHAVLLCGLLACAAVDVESWLVPLEVCWFVAIVGLLAATACPPPRQFLPAVSSTTGAMSIAAVLGLIIALILQKRGFIQPSFIDADTKSQNAGDKANRRAPKSVAITAESGLNPRKEILREVLFLSPAIILAVIAYFLVTRPWIGTAWQDLNSEAVSGRFAAHFAGFQAALFGYLIGGMWVWGIRILGTLAFGKEAMGLGDVHIMAAVGAVTGWIVPSIAFFVAPFLGLLWALYLWMGRGQRELPYGPWLATATLLVIIFYDAIMGLLGPYARAIAALTG